MADGAEGGEMSEQKRGEERERERVLHSRRFNPKVFGRPRRVCGQVTVETEYYGTSLW